MVLPRSRAANLRRASPAVSPTAGTRAAAGYVNPFISTYVPMLWGNLTPVFGRPVGFRLGGDPATETVVTIIWTEGVEGEVVSPGRYSRVKIQFADLPRQPKMGDVIVLDGILYDLARIESMPFPYCIAVLKDRLEDF